MGRRSRPTAPRTAARVAAEAAPDAKDAAIDAVAKSIETLERLLAHLRELQAGAVGHPPLLLQITRRCVDAEAELLDQRSLVAHLRAAHVSVQPMSPEARATLERLLANLDEAVRADQAFHRVLELADVIVGSANDFEHEIRELTT